MPLALDTLLARTVYRFNINNVAEIVFGFVYKPTVRVSFLRQAGIMDIPVFAQPQNSTECLHKRSLYELVCRVVVRIAYRRDLVHIAFF